jgi:hypothetical protein
MQPALRGDPAVERSLLLRGVACHIEGACDTNLRGMEGKAVRLHRLPVGRKALAGHVKRRELIQQQVMAAPSHASDRFRMAGTLPERRVRFLNCRRLDDDVVELPVLPAP